MTRINVVPVETLSTKHLIAEYREITRLPNNLKKSLNRLTSPFSLTEIPNEYTLGKGHVKFFYDKMIYLKNRYEQLVSEMLRRGYNPSFRDSSIFCQFPMEFNNDYKPTEDAININKTRILERS
jgi:hypothetical protein